MYLYADFWPLPLCSWPRIVLQVRQLLKAVERWILFAELLANNNLHNNNDNIIIMPHKRQIIPSTPRTMDSMRADSLRLVCDDDDELDEDVNWACEFA